MDGSRDKLRRRGRFVELAALLEAEPLTTPAVDGPFRDGGPDRVELAAHLHELGRVQWHLARFVPAEQHLTRALAIREQLLGPLDARTLDTRERLAALHHYRGDARAEPLFREVVAQRERVHGPDSAELAIAERNLGALLRDQGSYDAARELLESAAQRLERRLGREHADFAAALKARAFLLVAHPDEDARHAQRAADDALAITVRVHDLDHPFAGGARLLVAQAHLRNGRFSAAGREVTAALAALRAGYGDAHPLIGIALMDDGRIRLRQDDTVEALDCLRRGAEMHARWYPQGASTAQVAYEVAVAAAMARRPTDARTWVDRASAAVDGDLAAQRSLIEHMLAASEWAANLGDADTARRLLDRARELDADAREWREQIDDAVAYLAELTELQPA